MGGTRTVLLVADDPHWPAAVGPALAARGLDVRTAADGAAAEAELVRRPPDLLIVEMLLPGRSGFALAASAKDLSDGRCRVLMVAAGLSAAHRDYAFAAGVDAVLPGPVAPAAVLDAAAGLGFRPTARIGPPAPARLAAGR